MLQGAKKRMEQVKKALTPDDPTKSLTDKVQAGLQKIMQQRKKS